MKKVIIALSVILALLVICCVYFVYGAKIDIEHSYSRECDNITVDMTIKNGSVFNCDYIEFIAESPDKVVSSPLAGHDIARLSSADTSIEIYSPDGHCELQVGYYVFGSRRHIDIVID